MVRRKKIVDTLIFVVLLLIAGAFVFYIIQGRGKLRAIPGIREPIQTEASGTKDIIVSGYTVNLEYQYAYDIEALVVHTHEYTSVGIDDKVSPVDLGLAWGAVAENNTEIDFNWDQMNRFLFWEVKNPSDIAVIGDKYAVNSLCSNNHIIPATDDIKKQVLKIRRGDHVRLKGYLVNLTAQNSSDYFYEWNTSITREDSGAHACELFYVTGVEMLE